MANSQVPVWSIAIFAARENVQTLEKTIVAAKDAAIQPAIIDVLVNGNLELANETARLLRTTEPKANNRAVTVRVWFVQLGDKAHTFNQYFKLIWPKSRLAFFIDGYVRINPDALVLLDEAMSNSPDCYAGSGVPTVGVTAKSLRDEMLKSGGIHGNLFALKGSTVEALREMNFKLPLGLYRTDPTLGAALSFGLNPRLHAWDPKVRILVHPDVTWGNDERSPWRISDVSAQLKRILRQGQGILENLAVRNHFAVQEKTPDQLPATAADLVFQWVNSNPHELWKAMFRHPLLISLALRKLRQPREWSHTETAPELKYP